MTKHWRDSVHERNQDWINSREKPTSGDWHGGKGYRSRVTDTKKYQDNWNNIFGGDKNGTGTTEEPAE